MDWSDITQVSNFANGLLIIIIGILSFLGVRQGRGREKSQENQQKSETQIEVAGALVDSASVIALASALEAHNVEIVTTRLNNRKAVDSLIRAIQGLAKEVEELKIELIRRNGR